MNIQEVKQIRIADYLQSLGYTPVKQQGSSFWYKSPLREETDASFKVNTELNKWYDFGLGKGGTHHRIGSGTLPYGRCNLPVEAHRGTDTIHPPCIVFFWQAAIRQPHLSGIKSWRAVITCAHCLSARKGDRH